MFDLLIRGGEVVGPDGSMRADVAVSGERVAAIVATDSTKLDATRTIDATGLYVIPGGIDPHVHFNLDYGPAHSHDYDHGTTAAAAGGTTTVINFAMQYATERPIEGVRRSLEQAKGKAVTDFGLHLALAGQFTPELIAGLPELFAAGVPSVKIYMIYGTKPGWVGGDGGLWAVMTAAQQHGGMVMVHCENASIVGYLTQEAMRAGKGTPCDVEGTRPYWVEEEAMRRTFFLAEKAGCPLYVVHTSIKEGVALMREAKARHLPFYIETLSTYLHFTNARTCEPDGGLFINFPPMREDADQAALWKGIADGDVYAVGTDDFAVKFKDREAIGNTLDSIPVGVSGVELRVAVLLAGVTAGKITLPELVRVNSVSPAKIFGLYPKKGIIAVGSDADLALIDPHRKKTVRLQDLHSDTDYSIWDGLRFEAYPVMTVVKGKVVVENDRSIGEKGTGRFIPRTVPTAIRYGRL